MGSVSPLCVIQKSECFKYYIVVTTPWGNFILLSQGETSPGWSFVLKNWNSDRKPVNLYLAPNEVPEQSIFIANLEVLSENEREP